MGAGVVPISTDEKGVTHLLLGRERWIPNWRGSCRWSGFEGARKENEDVVTSACREFLEESMGVVRILDASHSDEPWYVIAQSIRLRKFWRRVVLKIDSERRSERYHCTYVVPVPWDPDVGDRFRSLRASIEIIDRLFQEWRYTRPRDIGELGEHIGPVCTNADDNSITVYKLACTSPCILRPPWRSVVNDSELVFATFTDPQQVQIITNWFQTRDRLERALISHACIRVVRDVRWGHVQDVCVHSDFLEKDQIRWWSINDLDAVIAERGQLGPERFRPYFLPVLQTILSETELLPPPTPPLQCVPVSTDPEFEEDMCESPTRSVP